MTAAIIGAVLMFAVLGFLSWKAKYGRGKTLGAVAAIDTVVLHQRVSGAVAQDRLVAIDGRTGSEYARTTVLRGELVGVRDDKVVYSIGTRFILYDSRTLESSPARDDAAFPPLTKFGALTDLGDAVLLLDTTPGTERARRSLVGAIRDHGRRGWVVRDPIEASKRHSGRMNSGT